MTLGPVSQRSGGGVASVTATLPIHSSGGANPDISISTDYYTVGAVGEWPYQTVAAAIAAAVADGATNAGIRILSNITEDIALPRGMSLTGLLQNGAPVVTVTGSITSALGVGRASVSGLVFIGNGAAITVGNASTNIGFTSCVMAQAADFSFATATAGANIIYERCSFIGSGLAASYGFVSNGANIVLQNCGATSIGSDLFANVIGGGAFTLRANCLTVGTITVSSGNLDAEESTIAAVGNACVNTTSISPCRIVNCQINSPAIGVNALQGTGTINFANMQFTNTQTGIDTTLVLTPYRVVSGTFGAVQTLAAAGSVVVNGQGTYQVAGNGGAVTLTSTPSITGSFFDGDTITIFGTSDADTLTIQDQSILAGSLLALNNNLNFTMGLNDNITLRWNAASNRWCELSRNDLA